MKRCESKLVREVNDLCIRLDEVSMASTGGNVESGKLWHRLIIRRKPLSCGGKAETRSQLKRTPVVVLKPFGRGLCTLTEEIEQYRRNLHGIIGRLMIDRSRDLVNSEERVRMTERWISGRHQPGHHSDARPNLSRSLAIPQSLIHQSIKLKSQPPSAVSKEPF